MDTENDLPRSNVRRIVKQKITQLKGASGTDVSLNKDALTALTESCRVFIHLLSATANDICLGNKRQTISVEDVIAALEDLEFGDLVSELEGNIEEHKKEMKERAKKRSEAMKKRKAEKKAEELANETSAAAAADNEEVKEEKGEPQPAETEGGEKAAGADAAAAPEEDAAPQAMETGA